MDSVMLGHIGGIGKALVAGRALIGLWVLLVDMLRVQH